MISISVGNLIGGIPVGSRGVALLSVTIEGLVNSEARHNVELTATVNGLSGGETVTYEWQEDTIAIGGETVSTFTPNIGTNVSEGGLIRVAVTVDGGAPIYSQAYPAAFAPAGAFSSAFSSAFDLVA